MLLFIKGKKPSIGGEIWHLTKKCNRVSSQVSCALTYFYVYVLVNEFKPMH